MLDKKELKEEELKKVNGGSRSAGIGNLAEDNVPEVGKLYNKEYSYYARVTAVDRMSDIVSYDIGQAQYDASVGYLWNDDDAGEPGSEGLFIDVYEDYLLIKGMDFTLNKWLPYAMYCIPYNYK